VGELPARSTAATAPAATAASSALAHNGNLINAVELHAELREREVTFSSTSDSEIIAALLATHPADDIEDAIADVMPRLHGAFSTVVMTKKRIYAFRDPAGVRRWCWA
jgi:amidophosphoribosyltransferase